MKTVKVKYGGFSAEQLVEENLYNAIYQQGREEKCDKCDYFISVEEAYKKGANRALELAVDLGYMSMDGWDAVEKKMLKE